MSTPGGATWNLESMTFIATSTSELLNFLAIGTPLGESPVSLLADVSLTQVPLTQVPEPGTFAVLGVGLLGLLTVVRVQSRRMG